MCFLKEKGPATVGQHIFESMASLGRSFPHFPDIRGSWDVRDWLANWPWDVKLAPGVSEEDIELRLDLMIDAIDHGASPRQAYLAVASKLSMDVFTIRRLTQERRTTQENDLRAKYAAIREERKKKASKASPRIEN